MTGTTFNSGVEVTFKRLQYLREIVPAAKRLSWLWNSAFFSVPTVAGGRFDMGSVMSAGARDLGFESRFHPVDTEQAVDAAFADIATRHAQALMCGTEWPSVPKLTLHQRLPSAFYLRRFVEAGGLMSFGRARSEDAYLDERLAWYMDRILRGARPAELPVERPNRYELVINLKTAKTLGLTVPQSLLARADEVIR